VWSRDGRELFYRSGDSIQSVAVGDAREFKAGPSRTVVTASFEPALRSPNYDVGPDARFVVVRSDAATPAPLQLVVIPDWSEELRHRTH
jgi:hypothetical protein